MSLRFVATIPVLADHVDAVRAALEAVVPPTREEPGCIAYELFESASTPGVFVTIEEWVDQDALTAHMSSPHLAAALGVVTAGLDGAPGMHPLRQLI